MLSGRPDDARELGQVYGLYAGAFIAFLVVLAILGQYGLADPFIAVLLVAVTLLSFAVIGVVGRTLSEPAFNLAGRAVPPVFNGLATSAAMVSGTGFIGFAGTFFASRATALALVVGTAAGFALLAILVAPYLRKSGAVTVPDFLAIRFGGDLPRAVGLLALLLLSFPALAGAIAAAVFIFVTFLRVDAATALDMTVAAILVATLLGGMRGVTLVAGAQAIVLLIGLLAPAAILSWRDYGLPVPQLTYGFALDEIAAADGALAAMASRVLPLGGSLGWVDRAAVALSLAAGIAALPHVVGRSLTARRVAGARRGAVWGLLFVAIVLLTAPALAAFVKAAVFRDLVGTALADLPDWVYAYGRAGLVRICGVAAADPAALKLACGAAGDGGALAAGQIALSPDMVALAFPDITGFPFVITALLAAGGLAAALGGANAIAITIATAIGRDFYGGLVAPFAPAGRRLIVTRVMAIVAVVAASSFAAARPADAFALAAAAPALAAGTFFPALVLGVWWRRATGLGVVAGIAAGFVAAMAHIVITWHGAGGPGWLGFGDPRLPPLAAGVFGLPAGFLAIVAVSLLTPAPSPRQLDILDAIRRPSRDPVLEAGGA